MTRKLHISASMSLPPEMVTSTTVVYGGKGMGKTNFGSVVCEEVHAAGLRFSLIDPMGVAWGLRHDVSGKSRGIEVLILGGIHGDIPIQPTAGAVVADLVADESVSVIIDISRNPDGTMWSIGERIRFVRDYCKQLYRRQGEQRRPLLQIFDEAARFAPQMIRAGDADVAQCAGALAVLVEEGRNVGIGVLLLTQRSARLSKDVAELADCMIAFRIIGPRSMDAVLDWLGEHVEKERLKELALILRKLPIGSALLISPGWLNFEGVVAMRARQTFDSSATPKPGQQSLKASGPGAKPDLARYQMRMAATIERAALDDPKILRAEIMKLRAELVARGKVKPAAVFAAPAAREVRMLTKADEAAFAKLDSAVAKLVALEADLAERAHKARLVVAEAIKTLRLAHLAAARSPATSLATPTRVQQPSPPSNVGRPIAPRQRAGTAEPSDLKKGERVVLTAVAQYPSGATRDQLSVLTRYKRSSRDTYIQRIREAGFVETQGEKVIVTQAGLDALGADFEPLPVGDALREHWLDKLPEGERRILAVAIKAFPGSVTREAIDEATEYKRSSRDTYLQRLSSRRLVESVGRGEVRASENLFGAANG